MNDRNRRFALRILPAALALLQISACASNDMARDTAEVRFLAGKFVEEPVTQPLVAVEAFIGPTDFYLSFKTEDGVVYSGGNWSNRVDLTALGQGTDESYAGPYILPLEYQQASRWAAMPEAPIVPRILSSKYWNRFIDEVFASVLPKADMTGIVMHFGEDDYFLYYNDINNFESRLLIDKPEAYVVAESIDFAEFVARAQPLMDEFLTREGIVERRIVFSTGDAGAYSLPFVYVDRDLPIGIFVRYSPAPTSRPGRDHGLADRAINRAPRAKSSRRSVVPPCVIDVPTVICRQGRGGRNRQADLAGDTRVGAYSRASCRAGYGP